MFYQFIEGGYRHMKYDIFAGCYGSEEEQTIHWLSFDSEQGTLEKKTSFSGVNNPSYLALNHKKSHLYAVSEVDEGEVVSFKIDFQTKHIEELNRQPTEGGPCYLEVGDHSNYLFTANYGGGSLIVHTLNDHGEIGRKIDFKEYGTPETSHLHTIRNIPNTTHYVGTDLGLNQLYFYDFDRRNGKLAPTKMIEAPQGSGPRHLSFNPVKNVLYVVNEHKSTVLTYAYDKHLDTVHLLQELSTLPENDYEHDNYGADIHVTPSGKYVYVSNRGHHSITAYEILKNGQLSKIDCISIEGDWPRNFTIVPNEKYILVANEHTNNIVVMKILNDGSLKYTGNQLNLEKPVCLKVI